MRPLVAASSRSFSLATKPLMERIKAMSWNESQVWPVYGGQDLDAPIAGPPRLFPAAGPKSSVLGGWLLPAAVLNVSVLTFCVAVTLGGLASGHNHDDALAMVPVIQARAVKPLAEPVTLVQAPVYKLPAESLSVTPVPVTEPPVEPVRRDRIFALEPEAKPEPVNEILGHAVQPEPEPVNEALGHAVQPEPGSPSEPQQPAWTPEYGFSGAEIERQSIAAGLSMAEARQNRGYVDRRNAMIASQPRCVPGRREAFCRSLKPAPVTPSGEIPYRRQSE